MFQIIIYPFTLTATLLISLVLLPLPHKDAILQQISIILTSQFVKYARKAYFSFSLFVMFITN